MSTPSTTIYMCKGVPLNNRYDHTLYFDLESSQRNYFMGKVDFTYNNYSYVRRSWKLKVAATMERARVWSYLFFQNGAQGKFYYYFINQVEYVNDSTVELSLELDVLQTYLFEWKLNPCYVEREHHIADIGDDLNVVEGLDMGEYFTSKFERVDLGELAVMTASTIDIFKYYMDYAQNGDKAVPEKIAGSTYDGIFGGMKVTATPRQYWYSTTTLMSILALLSEKGYAESVFTMWLYPLALVQTNEGGYEEALMKNVTSSKRMVYDAGGKSGSYFNGGNWQPKNNKLLRYPYRYLYVTNNNGAAAVYPYEYFTGSLPSFVIDGNIAPDATVKLTPTNYKGNSIAYDDALPLGQYPLCTWNNDTYKMWLAQNQSQQNLGLAMSGLKVAAGAAAIAGGVAATVGTSGLGAAVGGVGVTSGIGMVTSGATEIMSQLAQRADKEIQPPQAKGTYSGSYNVANGLQCFDIYHKTIDITHAKILDEYFTMYGYACRRVKRPNINARTSFSYVKTIGSNVTGDFAAEDVKLINNIFDKGVTFWKTGNIGDYTLDNTPLEAPPR